MPPSPPGVLVVDDNAVNRSLLLRQLERLGYRGTAVEGGAEAIDALRDPRYRLVLMDCRMPGVDGLEATRRIRAAEAGTGRRTPIVAITANAMDGDREACLAAGMDEYIAKPVLLQALRDVLSGHIGREPAESSAEPLGEVDADLVRASARTYLGELPKRIVAIHQAVRDGDADALALAAHTLRSTSALFGAGELAELCGEMERDARAGHAHVEPNRLTLLEERCDAVRSALEARLESEPIL